jgi:hypothetical protein
MQRPGADLENMQLADFLCDFCRRAWDGAFPMVEGHQGALICGSCLTAAYTHAVLRDAAGDGADTTADERTPEPGSACVLCLEERDDAAYRSPAYPDAVACRRCIKQAAGRLHKDRDWAWERPGGGIGQ